MMKHGRTTQVQTATALPMAPKDAQHRRIVQYSVAMGIRMVCIALVFVFHGWWIVFPAMGAIILPYLAVVLANVGSPYAGEPVRPATVNKALVRGDETA